MSEPSILIPNDLASLPQDSDEALMLFIEHLERQGLTPYPAQEEAMLELFEGNNVILNTPTGSGKSLVAAALHFRGLCLGRRSYYTCPIKALVNEKFLALCHEFGADHVGLITGDASVNATAPIICCTAEVLANLALADGEVTEVDDVIMDEFHFYSDRERGVAWQVPLLTLPNCRFLLMSATLGDTAFFEKELTRLTGAKSVTVRSAERPVPLEYHWEMETLDTVIETYGDGPMYLVHFAQRAATETAAGLLSLKLIEREQRQQIGDELVGVEFRSPFGKQMKKLLRAGIGLHHAGLLPKYRILVEKLAQKGLLKVICGTDTLGVGINVPIRTVVFTQLTKYDGIKMRILSVRDFHQIGGRAGRKGFDTLGRVIAIPPLHVIENLKAARKAAANTAKKKKVVKKKAPDGMVGWDEKTFQRLIDSPPEALSSSFQVSHGMLLEVLSRERGEIAAMRQLIDDCHESPVLKRRLRLRAFQMFRTLLEHDIVRLLPPSEEDGEYSIKVNVDLQEDFSLNQALSMYLIHALPGLDAQSEDYGYDLITLVESVLENPTALLRAQLNKAKGRAVASMKAEGIEYDERMEKLEEIDYPKPLSEFIFASFNQFRKEVPWVGEEHIRPKSIAREMVEGFHSFPDYVKSYGLEGSEGVLLRYLSQAWKAMTQTVPDTVKTESFREMEIYFESMIREIDSSLLDEWERIRDPNYNPAAAAAKRAEALSDATPAYDITRDRKAFTIQVRNIVFRLLRCLATSSWEEALDVLDCGEDAVDPAWDLRTIKSLREPFLEACGRIDFSAEARQSIYCRIDEAGDTWTVEQTVLADEPTEWMLRCQVDLAACRESDRVVLSLESFAAL